MSFQGVYDWIKNWKAPLWLKNLLQSLNDLMIAILKEVSKDYITYLKNSILEAASHSDWSNDEKFGYVFDKAKSGFTQFSIELKDREINLLIEFLVNQLKKTGII